MITRRLQRHELAKLNANKYSFESVTVLLLSLGFVQMALLTQSTVSVVVRFVSVLIIAMIFIANRQFFQQVRFHYKRWVVGFGIYGLVVLAHSIFYTKSYPQWSYLVNVYLPFLLLPYFCVLGAKATSLSKILKAFFIFTIPLSIVYLVIGSADKNTNLFFLNYISVIYLLIILIPFLKWRWQITVVIASIASVSFDLDNRSNIISVAFSYSLLLFYYFFVRKIGNELSAFFLNMARKLLLIGPLVLLILGALGVFNVFQYTDEEGSAGGVVVSTESGKLLSTDSRTGIYEDALNNLVKNNGWVFGTGVTVMYETHLAESNSDYNQGRLGGSESGFLALLTFGGIPYVVLMFALCFSSSQLAINNSNNSLIKLVGVFVAFRWLYLFIESPVSLNFTWVTLFLAIGMALNPVLRSASDLQMKNYFKRI